MDCLVPGWGQAPMRDAQCAAAQSVDDDDEDGAAAASDDDDDDVSSNPWLWLLLYPPH